MDLNHHLTQPFGVWLGGVGGVVKASLMLGTRVGSGNKGGIHGLKSSLDSAIWGLVGGGGGGDKSVIDAGNKGERTP